MSHHILVVEDEPDINKTVSYNIANEGLKPLSALNLTEAESYISSNNTVSYTHLRAHETR